MKLPEWLLVRLSKSLIGEIYPEIRAIVVRFDQHNNLLIRWYMDREPTDEDFENLEIVLTNFFSLTPPNEQISCSDPEIIFTTDKIKDLDNLDGFVYARKDIFG